MCVFKSTIVGWLHGDEYVVALTIREEEELQMATLKMIFVVSYEDGND